MSEGTQNVQQQTQDEQFLQQARTSSGSRWAGSRARCRATTHSFRASCSNSPKTRRPRFRR